MVRTRRSPFTSLVRCGLIPYRAVNSDHDASCTPTGRFPSLWKSGISQHNYSVVLAACQAKNRYLVSSDPQSQKAAIARGLCRSTDDAELLGCHFFGFAFLPHQLQFALRRFDLRRDFLLDASRRFFQLR